MTTTRGRTSRRFKTLAANLRSQRRPCCICHQPIDYNAPPRTPNSFTVEHLQPRSTHPHLAEEPTNLDAAHWSCNSSRQDRTIPNLGTTSQNW